MTRLYRICTASVTARLLRDGKRDMVLQVEHRHAAPQFYNPNRIKRYWVKSDLRRKRAYALMTALARKDARIRMFEEMP